jgi:hypothetical protein
MSEINTFDLPKDSAKQAAMPERYKTKLTLQCPKEQKQSSHSVLIFSFFQGFEMFFNNGQAHSCASTSGQGFSRRGSPIAPPFLLDSRAQQPSVQKQNWLWKLALGLAMDDGRCSVRCSLAEVLMHNIMCIQT